MTRVWLLLTLALGLAVLAQGRPDLCQQQPQFPGDGSMYCGPVAVSNDLAWLASKGYPRLCPAGQVALAAHLGSLMRTDAEGTGVGELRDGVRKYLGETGYRGQLKTAGWRPGGSGAPVDLAWLAEQLADSGCVWLNIGWYSGSYERFGGHWVTLVGVEPGTLLVHDPSPRSGTLPRTETVAAEKLTAGTLQGSSRGLPRPAAGCLRLTGLPAPKRANAVILDGAVALRLDPPAGLHP